MIKEKDLNKQTFFILTLALVAFKLLLVATQFVTVQPVAAPLDDHLMFNMAKSITQGQWLGAYGPLTLSKHAFFAIWLAFLHVIGIPFTVGNAILWAFACLVFITALAPVMKKRYFRLFIFAGMLYNPASWASYTTRIYRDSIFPALCLIFFSALMAIGLRYQQPLKQWWKYLLLYGISVGAIYLTREDGIWIMPFAVVATVVIIGVLWGQKEPTYLKKTVALIATPLALALLCIGAYCAMNYSYYGRFIISDFSQGEFKQAYGAMASILQENPKDSVAVNEEVRLQLYKEVPTFALLEDVIESDGLKNGFYDRTLQDFKGGSFYWAIRMAAAQKGYYDTPEKAQAFYQDIYKEIVQAVEEGRLVLEGKMRNSVSPAIRLRYVKPTFQEAWRSWLTVIQFQQTDPLAEPALGTVAEIEEVESFIHQKGSTVYKENSEELYLSPIRHLTHKGMRLINMIYRVFIPVMLLLSVLWQIKQLNHDLFHKKFTLDTMLNIVMLGFLGMAIFRIFMIAYVEVSSFTIGTYIMYLSTVHPLIIAYSFIGSCKTFEH